jgi:hypothetical protein
MRTASASPSQTAARVPLTRQQKKDKNPQNDNAPANEKDVGEYGSNSLSQ